MYVCHLWIHICHEYSPNVDDIYIYTIHTDPSWVIVITTLGPFILCRPSFKVKFNGGSFLVFSEAPAPAAGDLQHGPAGAVAMNWRFPKSWGYPRMDGLFPWENPSINDFLNGWFRDTPIFGNPSHHPIFVWHCPYKPSIFLVSPFEEPLILHKFSLSRKDLNDR